MQIDLQPPLAITKITHGGKITHGDPSPSSNGDSQLKFEREGNVYWVMFEKDIPKGTEDQIEIFYEGVPVVSRNPPWVGGITWGRDDLGEHFIVTTCQGIGASIWWPNKDHGADEPDRGMQISVTVPENLAAVSNGRLKKTDHDAGGKKKTFHWEVLNPINNYRVNINIGNYINLTEKYQGKGGVLDFYFSHSMAAGVYDGRKMYPEAIGEARLAKALSPDQTWSDVILSMILVNAGRPEESRAILDQLLLRSKSRFVPPYHIASVYNNVGDKEQALDWLEKAYAIRDPKMTFLNALNWKNVENDPRFQNIRRRVGIVGAK